LGLSSLLPSLLSWAFVPCMNGSTARHCRAVMTEWYFTSSRNGHDDGHYHARRPAPDPLFLLVMLTSIFAGWRQCQMMRSKPPPTLTMQEAMEQREKLRAKHGWDGRTMLRDSTRPVDIRPIPPAH